MQRLKKILLGIFLFITFITSLNAGNINIAVAANVSYAIEELTKEFNKKYPDIKVGVTLGSSGKLTAQINYGAPYQLFMSANMNYPNALYAKGFAITKPLVYAQGSLAYFSNKKRDFTQGIEIVKNPKIKRIAVANPKTAPYGIATAEALKNAGVYKTIQKKFIYGESISQTVSYTVTASDLGFIAKSSLFSPRMKHFKKGVHWEEVDSTLYTPISQGIVILKRAKENNDVLAFYNFMLSDKAQKILKDFGYLIP